MKRVLPPVDSEYIFTGFLELPQDDQIKLIKLGSFEVVIMRYVPLFEEDGMYIPSMDMKIPRYGASYYSKVQFN